MRLRRIFSSLSQKEEAAAASIILRYGSSSSFCLPQPAWMVALPIFYGETVRKRAAAKKLAASWLAWKYKKKYMLTYSLLWTTGGPLHGRVALSGAIHTDRGKHTLSRDASPLITLMELRYFFATWFRHPLNEQFISLCINLCLQNLQSPLNLSVTCPNHLM